MKLIGHRGARGEAPENTLSGFRHLQALGVLAVELDIQVSRDGELVVIHDSSLERSTLSTGKVADHDTTQLAAVDALHRHFPDWPGQEGIPTLRQVMEVLRDFRHIQFEVKASTEADCLRVVSRFPALWQEFGFGERGFCTSFNPRFLKLLAETAPDIPRGFLFEKDFAGDAISTALALGCRSLGPHQERCTVELVTAAHAADLRISTWTVNSVEHMRALAEIGVDSLITDYPTLALTRAGHLFDSF